MKFLVKFDLEFDLKFEISDGKNLVTILGEDFSTCQESTENFGANFGANFGEKFGNFVSNFATSFGNFVQQKGGANKSPSCRTRNFGNASTNKSPLCGPAFLR